MASVNYSDDPARFAYLAEGNARQARKRVAVDLLLRDNANRALLVNPVYKDFWDVPGGMAEANEPLVSTARRELREELGIDVSVGRLLVVDWVGPRSPWDDQLIFIFDGGVLDSDTVSSIKIVDDEIDEFAFLPLEESEQYLRPDMWGLLLSAYRCLEENSTLYFENHKAP